MTITLEEQIEYMREEIAYQTQRGDPYCILRCQAIFATLEAVKKYQDGLASTKPEPGP